MHEFSIATDLVENVMEFANAHGPCSILKIRLQVGELTCIDHEQLRFCYESIVHGTPLETSKLEIEQLPAAVACPYCAYQGSPKYWEGALSSQALATLLCPLCGQAAEAIQGHDCVIKTIQYEQRQSADTPN
jgi:hydrogenase nickel incorporation protein HypA/HybF